MPGRPSARGRGDALRIEVGAAGGGLPLTGIAGRVCGTEPGTGHPQVPDVDVVATDGDRDQVGVRAKGVELRWVGSRPHRLRSRHVVSPRSAAADVGIVPDLQCLGEERRIVAGGPLAADRIGPLLGNSRTRRIGVTKRDVMLRGTRGVGGSSGREPEQRQHSLVSTGGSN